MKRGAAVGLVMLLAAAGPPPTDSTSNRIVLYFKVAMSPPPPGASSCSGCHGEASPIAGKDAAAMSAKLNAFRSGARQSTVMGRIAKGFSTEELSAIAAWWAAQK